MNIKSASHVPASMSDEKACLNMEGKATDLALTMVLDYNSLQLIKRLEFYRNIILR